MNERKELNNKKIEKENQSKNISQNDDKETINNLRNYISELQSAKKKKCKKYLNQKIVQILNMIKKN